MIKVYQKRGNLSYKERRYVTQLTKVLEKKLEDNPNYTFNVAENVKDLEKLYNEHCIDDVEFTEVTDDNMENNEPNLPENENSDDKEITTNQTTTEDNDDYEWDEGQTNSDPFNRDEPIVRDYVYGSDFPDDKVKADTQNTYEEPRTQKAQMRMPGVEEPEVNNDNTSNKNTSNATNTSSNSNNNSSSNTSNNSTNSSPKPNNAPINPKFNEMSDAQKKKQTGRMAKSIIRLGATIGEKLFEYWGTKGITEEEISDLENQNLIDTDLEVASISDPNALVTIKTFFAEQRILVSDISKISEEERQMLTESLTEVMLEKGIGPTPMQNFLLGLVEVCAIKVLAIYGLQKQNSTIIEQLKDIKTTQVAQFREQQEDERRFEKFNQPVYNNEKSVEVEPIIVQ